MLYIFGLNYFEFPALLTGHFSKEKAREIQNSVNKKWTIGANFQI